MRISFNTDSDGFISRECPACERRFKVQPGKGSPRPVSHCPFCGHFGTDCWFTPEQAEYLRAIALRDVVGPELGKLDRAMRNLGNGSGGMIRVTVTGRMEQPPAPRKPEERDGDMTSATTFACCGEAVRHGPADHARHCIICGIQAHDLAE